jgi:hypothetical protein
LIEEVGGKACFTIESVIKDKDGNIKHHSIIDEDGEEKVYI